MTEEIPQSAVMIPDTGLFTCSTNSWSFTSSTKIEVLKSQKLTDDGYTYCQSLATIILQKYIKDRSDPLFIALRLLTNKSCLGIKFRSNARFVEIYYGDMNANSLDSNEIKYLTTSKASPLPSEGNTAMYQHEYDLPAGVPFHSSIHFKMLSMRQPDNEIVQCRLENVLLAVTGSGGSGSPSPSPVAPASPSQSPRNNADPQQLQEARNTLQNLRTQLQGTQRAVASGMNIPIAPVPGSTPTAATAASQGNKNDGLIGLIATLSLPNSPLMSVVTQMQKTMLTDFNKMLDEKMSPVMQRLDKLEDKLQKLSVLSAQTQALTMAQTEIQAQILEQQRRETSVVPAEEATNVEVVTVEAPIAACTEINVEAERS